MGHSIKYSVSTSRVWQDTQSYIRPQQPVLQSYKKAAVRRRLSRQAETGTNAVAAQVWQAVSLLSLHLDTIISMKRRMIMVMIAQLNWFLYWFSIQMLSTDARPNFRLIGSVTARTMMTTTMMIVWYLLFAKKKWKPFLEAWKSDILVLVAPAVKGAGPRLKAGVDLKVFPELPLDDGEGGAAATLQVLLRMVSRLCVWAKFMLSKFFVILALQSGAISTSEI